MQIARVTRALDKISIIGLTPGNVNKSFGEVVPDDSVDGDHDDDAEGEDQRGNVRNDIFTHHLKTHLMMSQLFCQNKTTISLIIASFI
jgi:hypothetical protein